MDYIVLIETEDVLAGKIFDTYREASDFEYCLHEKYRSSKVGGFEEVITVILTDKQYELSRKWLDTSHFSMDMGEKHWKLYSLFLRDVIAGFENEWYIVGLECKRY